MARCRVVVPETVRLTISEGDWLDVKKRLTYGERKKASASLVREVRADGRVTPEFEMVGLAQVMAYLVDWSLVDAKGKQIPIDTDDRKLAALRSMDEATVEEIEQAIEKHAEAMDAEASDSKKTNAGSPELVTT
jgi:hypothetical protein